MKYSSLYLIHIQISKRTSLAQEEKKKKDTICRSQIDTHAMKEPTTPFFYINPPPAHSLALTHTPT